MAPYRKKMIEVAMPLDAINRESAREKAIRHGHPSTLHLWWARRPLASCRAVLFGQLVDDPSAWPERFPTQAAQDAERARLFGILEELVLWENSNDSGVLDAARKEIARSVARNRVAGGEGSARDDAVLTEPVAPEVVDAYLAEVAPPVHDPFAGGGSIPLEAQRLGLRAVATDLNPVAVLINEATIEIPPRFAGRAPVHPRAERRPSWNGAAGLAEDLRCYGGWMRDRALARVGHLYPEVDLPQAHGGGKATVIAWLWARTVASPDPAQLGVHVPLVSSYFLSTRKGSEAWVEPVIEGRDYRFEVRTGTPRDPAEIQKGTKLGRGAHFRCLLSGSPIEPGYIKAEGRAGRMAARLMAIVAGRRRQRIYLAPQAGHAEAAARATPAWRPTGSVPARLTGGTCFGYGLTGWGDLFTPRQLVTLATFSDLIQEARDEAIADARAAGWRDDAVALADGGTGATAYGDALAVYLAFAVDKMTDTNSALCSWQVMPPRLRATFGRQALPMVWDYAEACPFSDAAGDYRRCIKAICEVLQNLPSGPAGRARLAAARDALLQDRRASIATDPPYYDNIGYADLADYFYVWLRRSLRPILPRLFDTVLVPKAEELVATPYRHGGKDGAERFFLSGMSDVMASIADRPPGAGPVAIYYAFKQSDTRPDGTSSTGWETFLEALLAAGLAVAATWPARTELGSKVGIVSGKGANMLASSIVLACRRRVAGAPSITRGDFRRALLAELPAALLDLQKGNVAPVDMAQASIGPGMAVFSRHGKVVEADGTAMSVRAALQLINEVVDEVRGGEELDLDPETRFAISWFEMHGFQAGRFGDSETLATSRNVSVAAVVQAGLLHSAAGRTRLLTRDELPADWDPAGDPTLTVWECTQHLIKRLEERGEQAAAGLLHALGPRAEAARSLAYRLYTHCERKPDAGEARAYNGLVAAWPELESLAARSAGAHPKATHPLH